MAGSVRSGALALALVAACGGRVGSDDADSSSSGLEVGTSSTSSTSSTEVTTTSTSTGEDVDTSSSSGPPPPDLPATECTVHADPDGDDEKGCGAAGLPCRTLSHAITLADDGCTIVLAAGTYSAETGELLPWVPEQGVSIVGAGADQTVLDDAVGASNELFPIVCDADHDEPPVRAALVLDDNTVSALTVHGASTLDYRTVLVLGGTVVLSEITVTGGQEGIFVTNDAEASIVEADVSGAGHAGIKPAGDAIVTIERSRMHGSKDAVEPICRATTTVRESEAFCNGNGLEALDRAHTTLIDNDVHHNVNGIASRGVDTVVVARGNRVHDNAFGVVAIFTELDAGTAAEPGGNEIGPNRFIGMLLANVPSETPAIGNTWAPLLDGADADGGYAPGTIVMGPVCSPHLAEIELPPPDPCDPGTPIVVADDAQNYALRDGSCNVPATCGGGLPACPASGALVLGAP